PITGSSSVASGQSGVSYSISSVSGATTYTWTVPSGATIASGQGSTSITVNFGCGAASGNVTVTPSNGTCDGTGSSLAVTDVGVAGTYTVTITDANGCTNSCSASLTVNSLPTCSITPPSATVCSPQTQQFCAPAGMSSYAWTGPGGFSSNAQCITVGTTGSYNVTIVDGNGCSNSCSALLTVNTAPSVSANPTNIAACVGGNANFSVTASGTSPLSYFWRKRGSGWGAGGWIFPSTSGAAARFLGSSTDNNFG